MALDTQLAQNSNFPLEKMFENLARFLEPIAIYLMSMLGLCPAYSPRPRRDLS
jgi:hypothetical protein